MTGWSGGRDVTVTSTRFDSVWPGWPPIWLLSVHCADAVLEMTWACAAGVTGSEAAAISAVTKDRYFRWNVIAGPEEGGGSALSGATPAVPSFRQVS